MWLCGGGGVCGVGGGGARGKSVDLTNMQQGVLCDMCGMCFLKLAQGSSSVTGCVAVVVGYGCGCGCGCGGGAFREAIQQRLELTHLAAAHTPPHAHCGIPVAVGTQDCPPCTARCSFTRASGVSK